APPMICHKPLWERQGSRRLQNGLPSFGCAPDNAVGAVAARVTFSSTFHRPLGLPCVAPRRSQLSPQLWHYREDRRRWQLYQDRNTQWIPGSAISLPSFPSDQDG